MGKRIQIARRYEKGIKAGSDMYRLGQKMRTIFGYDCMDMPRLNPSPKDLIGGDFGAIGKLYEMEGGVVLCYDCDYQNGQVWDVWLLGFSEENETYQKLKRDLEELASGNPEGVEKTIKTHHLNSSEELQKWMEKYGEEFLKRLDSEKMAAPGAEPGTSAS